MVGAKHRLDAVRAIEIDTFTLLKFQWASDRRSSAVGSVEGVQVNLGVCHCIDPRYVGTVYQRGKDEDRTCERQDHFRHCIRAV